MTAEERKGRWKVPSTWKWVTAKEIASIVGGGTPDTSDPENFSDDGTPWLTPADLSDFNGAYIAKGRRSLTDKGLSGSAARLLPKGSVLFSSRAPIGYCVIAKNTIATNQGFKSLVLRDGIDPRFVRYYLLASKEYANRIASGTTFRELSAARMAEYSIPIAPSKEQKRIVAKIDELFARLDAAEAGIKKPQQILSAYRQSALFSAVTGRLDRSIEKESMFAPIGGMDADHMAKLQLPDGWRWEPLDRLLSKIEAGKNVRCIERPPVEGEIGIVKVSAVSWGKFLEEESKTLFSDAEFDRRNRIAPGDFLFSRANTQQLVGACVIVDEISKDLVLSDKILRFRFNDDVADWALWALRSIVGRRQIEAFASGNQESMRNISQQSIRKILIPLPPKAQRKAILGRVSLIMQSIEEMEEALRTKVANVSAMRQSILSAAFRGELVPQDASDEPAEELLERIRAQHIVESAPVRVRNGKRRLRA